MQVPSTAAKREGGRTARDACVRAQRAAASLWLKLWLVCVSTNASEASPERAQWSPIHVCTVQRAARSSHPFRV